MDNKVALSCLLKMKATHSPDPLKTSKSIWHYLFSRGDHNYCRVFTKQIECPIHFIYRKKKDRAQADWARADWESQNASGSSN